VAASKKHTLFALKNGNSNFCEAKPETLFGRVVCNEKLHTLAKFWELYYFVCSCFAIYTVTWVEKLAKLNHV
jgi:hypothetical protein